jgi:hypothetical protein
MIRHEDWRFEEDKNMEGGEDCVKCGAMVSDKGENRRRMVSGKGENSGKMKRRERECER